jgi:glycosyltransferase involved in cell wall biosynthesis
MLRCLAAGNGRARVRIALLNQFYPPDAAPTGHYLHDVARVLVARGHQVRVYASRRAYAGGGDYAARESIDGVDVVRVGGFGFGRDTYAGKFADHGAYAVGLAARLAIERDWDAVVALTSPPLLAALARAASTLGHARVVHWVMDVYPDALGAFGGVGAVASGMLGTLARGAYAGAAGIVVLGSGMAERVRAHAGRAAPIEIVPLWTPSRIAPWPEAEPVPSRRARGWEDGRLTMLYSGNLGLGHRFEEFLAAADRLGPRGPRWVFAGQGRGRAEVERFLARRPDAAVELRDPVGADALREHLCSSDVHLASIDARWSGIIAPSKLQAAFGVAKPVIFVGSAKDDIARAVGVSGGGWVVPENDVDALVACVREAVAPGAATRRGQLGHVYARAHFDAARNAARVADVIEHAGAGVGVRR